MNLFVYQSVVVEHQDYEHAFLFNTTPSLQNCCGACRRGAERCDKTSLPLARGVISKPNAQLAKGVKARGDTEVVKTLFLADCENYILGDMSVRIKQTQ